MKGIWDLLVKSIKVSVQGELSQKNYLFKQTLRTNPLDYILISSLLIK